MTQQDKQSLEDFEKAYKRKISFAILKGGKPPPRKGLLRTICYLSGLGQWYSCVGKTGQGRKGYNRYCRLVLNLPTLSEKNLFLDFFEEYINKNVAPYLGDCIFNFDELQFGHIGIEYKSSEVRWYLIDYELNLLYKENCYTTSANEFSDGYTNVLRLRQDTEKTLALNNIVENMSHILKITDCINFLESNGYNVVQKKNLIK